MPLIVQFKFFDKQNIKLFFDGGFFLSYWAFAKVNGVTPDILNSLASLNNNNGEVMQYLHFANYSEKYPFNKIRDNRFEIGSVVGITVSYDLNKKFSSFISSRFYKSVNDQQKKYMLNQLPRCNQTLFISIGCLMNLVANKSL